MRTTNYRNKAELPVENAAGELTKDELLQVSGGKTTLSDISFVHYVDKASANLYIK